MARAKERSTRGLPRFPRPYPLPVDWHDWLVLMMLLCLVFWAALIVLAGVASSHWRAGVVLLAANGLAWLLLQTTTLYGGA